MKPVYAQFLDSVETLEVVVELSEVSRCKVLVEIDGEVTAVRDQSVCGDPTQHLDCTSLSISTYVLLLLSES